MQEDSSPSKPPGKLTIRYRICKIFLHFVACLFSSLMVLSRVGGQGRQNMRPVSSVLFGDLLRTVAGETASQIALRTCSEEVGAGASAYMTLVKGAHPVKHTSQGKVAASP